MARMGEREREEREREDTVCKKGKERWLGREAEGRRGREREGGAPPIERSVHEAGRDAEKKWRGKNARIK